MVVWLPTCSTSDFELTELVDRPREDPVSGANVNRQALARQDRLINGGPAPEHRAVGRDPLSRPDQEHVAGRDRVGRDLRLLAVPKQASRSRPILQQLLDRPLRPLEGQGLEALAQEGDEDDLRGHEVFSGQTGRHTGDGQRDVGADPSFQESQESEIDDPPAADERRDKGQANPEGAGVRFASQKIQQNIATEQGADDHGGQNQGATFGFTIGTAVRLVGLAGRHRLRVVFSVHGRRILAASSISWEVTVTRSTASCK